MANEFYDGGVVPATGSSLSSATMRAEFAAIEAGFDKLPALTGGQNKLVKVNAGGTALETTDAPDINGGTIDGAPVGASTPSTGAFTTLTSSSTTTLNGTTIPASKTLVDTDSTQTLSGKSVNLSSNTLTATLAQLNTAISDADVPSTTGSGASGTWGISVSGNAATVTNGVYTTGDQTIAGTKTFSSAPVVPDGSFVLSKLSSTAYGTSGANKLLQLDDAGKLPALDGSQLTGISSLPAQTGNSGKVLKTNGTSASWDGAGVLGTAVATTSGTAIDFTGIPSWVKRITVLFNGVSTNGTSNLALRIGASGGIESTGYSGSGGSNSATTTATLSTTDFRIDTSAAVNTTNGGVVIANVSGNTWVAFGVFGGGDFGYVRSLGGTKTLSGTLDRVRLTTLNGTDTFDAGSVNIILE